MNQFLDKQAKLLNNSYFFRKSNYIWIVKVGSFSRVFGWIFSLFSTNSVWRKTSKSPQMGFCESSGRTNVQTGMGRPNSKLGGSKNVCPWHYIISAYTYFIPYNQHIGETDKIGRMEWMHLVNSTDDVCKLPLWVLWGSMVSTLAKIS